jgi:hypothetical protein
MTSVGVGVESLIIFRILQYPQDFIGLRIAPDLEPLTATPAVIPPLLLDAARVLAEIEIMPPTPQILIRQWPGTDL